MLSFSGCLDLVFAPSSLRLTLGRATAAIQLPSIGTSSTLTFLFFFFCVFFRDSELPGKQQPEYSLYTSDDEADPPFFS